MANQEPDGSLKQEDVWPPPPSVPLPAIAPQQPFVVRLSLEMLILVDLGTGLASGALFSLLRWLSHKPFDWQVAAIEAGMLTSTIFVLHLCLRSYFKKRREVEAQAVDQT